MLPRGGQTKLFDFCSLPPAQPLQPRCQQKFLNVAVGVIKSGNERM